MKPKKGEGLKETADREAEQAEAEAAGAKGKKPVSDAPRIWNRTATQEEIARAEGVLQNLRDEAHDMGPEAVIDALLQIVDVHPDFKVPNQWPGKSDETLVAAPFIAEIGKLMLRGCPKLEVSPSKVVFLWRNKKTWTSGGVTVFTKPVSLGELSTYFAKGAVAAVIANYQMFRIINTRQKNERIYAALRRFDAEGVIQPVQFSGFYDQIQLFGTGTNESDVHLIRAIEQGSRREAQLPFPFPPMSVGDPDGESSESPKARRVS